MFGDDSGNNPFGSTQQFKPQKNITTKFSDVLGIDEFKEELEDIVDYLKNPEKYQDLGAYIPKGILMVGEPGTGKTLLARALAGEAECSFFYACGSEFDQIFVGSGAKGIRELFKAARENKPSMIFIDEIDSLANSRFAAKQMEGSNSTLNQILTELDGFRENEQIIIIGATNSEKTIDPAIKRPGRFDKTLQIPLPDVKGREQIIKHYLAKVKHDPKISIEDLAKKTSNYTGAELKNLINLSVIKAVRSGKKAATDDDLDFAVNRILMGVRRKTLSVTDEERYRAAIYESAKAVATLLKSGSSS